MVTPKQQLVLEEYAGLVTQIKALEAVKSGLKQTIHEILSSSDNSKIEVNGVTFSVGKRKVWSYPPEVQSMSSSLEQMKKDCQTDGLATFETTEYIICR